MLSLVDLRRGDPGIQAFQGLPEGTGEQDLPVTFAAKGAVLPQHLRVVGKGYVPAQLILQKMASALLNEDVFGVIVAHGVTYLFFILLFSSLIFSVRTILSNSKNDNRHN